jgi:hypothetical protein
MRPSIRIKTEYGLEDRAEEARSMRLRMEENLLAAQESGVELPAAGRIMRQKTTALIAGFQGAWKKSAPMLPPAPIDANKLYSPKAVASILQVSYNTALRKMSAMHGGGGHGHTGAALQAGKKMVRIKGTHRLEFLRSRQKN